MANKQQVAVPSTAPSPAIVEKLNNAAAQMSRPEQDAESMALAILGATTLDEILGSTVLHAADLVGTSFLVTAAYLNDSEISESLGKYAVMECIMQDGKRAVITTGATNIVMQLVAMHANGFFPSWVQVKSDTAKSGFTVYRLVRGAGDPVTAEQLTAF